MMRSKPSSLRTAAASNWAVRKLSMVFSKASSWSRTNSSAPMDSGFFITSRANSVPVEITVIVASWTSLILRAASTAFSSNPLTTGGMLGGGTTFLESPSIRNAAMGISGSSTCFARTPILTAIVLLPASGRRMAGNWACRDVVKHITKLLRCQLKPRLARQA